MTKVDVASANSNLETKAVQQDEARQTATATATATQGASKNK
jgi:hypothetical protein